MDKEKIKLLLRNIEILLDSLKAEIYSDSFSEETKDLKHPIFDYEEVFEDYDCDQD